MKVWTDEFRLRYWGMADQTGAEQRKQVKFYRFAKIIPGVSCCILAVAALFIACDKDSGLPSVCDPSKTVCPVKIIDLKDNKEYPVVQIGCQCWLGKNLDFRETGKCYDELEENCDVFGVLYTWDDLRNGELYSADEPSVQGLCPELTHIPTVQEWKVLFEVLGGTAIAGGKLKSDDLWDPSDSDTLERSGFKALPAGIFGLGQYILDGYVTYLFSSTTFPINDRERIWVVSINAESSHAVLQDRSIISGVPNDVKDKWSCRCIVD
jgi:uncharacterized protein (TIGR02145 family)